MKQPSSFLSINWQDLGKGLLVTVLGAIFGALYPITQTGVLPTTADIKGILVGALGAGIGYLLKNYLTNSNNEMLKKEARK